MVAPLILGVNPLVGVDHISSDRARQTQRSMSLQKATEVVRSAVEAGAAGLTFSPSGTIMSILRELQRSGEKSELKLYPVLPSLEKYWPVFLSRGTHGLISAIFEDLSLSAKAGALMRGSALALTLNPAAAIGLYIDIELSKIRAVSPQKWKVDTLFLGETFTDMLLSLHSYEMLDVFCRQAERHRGASPGLQTRNLVMLLSAFEHIHSKKLPAVMAPFNPLGFQMTPNREACEAAAARSKSIEFVAISVLAAGQLSVAEAIEYLSARKSYLRSIAVGTSNPFHATDTFRQFKQSLFT